MTRAYSSYAPFGARKRCEPITVMFTKAEKARVLDAAAAAGVPMSVFIHRIVLGLVDAHDAAA